MPNLAVMNRRRPLLVLAAVLLAGACSGSVSSQGAPTSPAAASTTAATSIATTTVATTTTVVETTLETLMSAPDSTLPAIEDTVAGETLPRPQDPPPPGRSVPRQQIGSLKLPAIDIDMPMFEGVELPTLDKGPGHWPGTAMPGRLGNVVIAGHRTSHNRPFYNIDKMKEGDEVVFEVDGGRYVYLVNRIEIVTPDALWILKQTPAKTATLFACHPKGSTKYRIVVFADYAPDKSTPAV